VTISACLRNPGSGEGMEFRNDKTNEEKKWKDKEKRRSV